MATVLFMVKASIPKEKEEAFNRWYNEVHVPMFLQFNGAVSARRYKAILGEDKFQYLAMYELKDEATFKKLMDSDHFKALKADYDAKFGSVSESPASPTSRFFPDFFICYCFFFSFPLPRKEQGILALPEGGTHA
jgi:uncharacterized protein (TIGR02118 family)